MLEKEQWPPNNSPNLNGMEISCLGIHALSYFETFIRSPKVSELKVSLEKIWDNFPQLSRVLQTVRQEYANGDRKHSMHLSLLKQVFALTAFALS